MHTLAEAFPDALVEGIEPVAELREQALRLSQIGESHFHDGDSLHLPYADNSFDWVVETGVLHHIQDWQRAVEEMVRVARYGVLISDTNTIGAGGKNVRKLKKIVKKLGCWNLIHLATDQRQDKQV